MWHMPKTQKYLAPTSWTSSPNYIYMAFIIWSMDIVGNLPIALGGKVFMLAMIGYFSKWIEVEAIVQVREKEVISLIKCNMLT